MSCFLLRCCRVGITWVDGLKPNRTSVVAGCTIQQYTVDSEDCFESAMETIAKHNVILQFLCSGELKDKLTHNAGTCRVPLYYSAIISAITSLSV
jgi:hypothetical protein